MIKSIIAILTLLFIIGSASGQPYNVTKSVTKIYDFKADSLKLTNPFNLGDNEGLRVTIYANDTSSAGYASDSIVAYWGLQYGDVTTNYLDQKDTMWVEPTKVIDTFRMATAKQQTLLQLLILWIRLQYVQLTYLVLRINHVLYSHIATQSHV
jgi:hypothetical protein